MNHFEKLITLPSMDNVTTPSAPVRRPIIGVMGTHNEDPEVLPLAEELGQALARRGFILLTGGGTGAMRAASLGASRAGGLVIGILPNERRQKLPGYPNAYIDIPIYTGMGDARNVINVKTADAVVALPGGPGTLSEIALALKADTPVIALNAWHHLYPGRIIPVRTVAEAMSSLTHLFSTASITSL